MVEAHPGGTHHADQDGGRGDHSGRLLRARPRQRLSMVNAILVRDLRKSYGAFAAVRGIDFEVAPGEVFGLLGPNGAGKTTTVEILEGYRRRDAGIVSVLGQDPERWPRDLRRRVGIVLQATGMYRHITVREALTHWARFYPHPRAVDEVLSLAG